MKRIVSNHENFKRMKYFFQAFTSFLLLILLATSCIFIGPSIKGNGDVVREIRDVDDFSSVKVSHGLEVHLVPDKSGFVVVEADNNLLQTIETEVSGNELKIYTKDQIRLAESKKVFVHYQQIDRIRSSSGSFVYTDEILQSKSLILTASSGSHQKIAINTSRLNTKCSSGAHISIEGKSQEATFKASSGSHIKAKNLITDKSNADVSSGGHITFTVLEQLDGEASSGGHIYYYGKPKETYINKSSGGQIISQ